MDHTRGISAVALLVFATGCGIFGGEDGSKNNPVVHESGGGGSGGSAPATCAGLAGPTMVEMTTPNGTAYCIDQTEVTQAQYKEFLADAPKPGSEHPECSSNTSYAPREEHYPEPGGLCRAGETWTPAVTPDHPVVCIDWCDAFAFCKWAGKRLCGRVGGGRLDVLEDPADPKNPLVDPNESQWYNACSQGGKTAFPYGDTYAPMACRGSDGFTSSTSKDVMSWSGCHGNRTPFDQVYDMSGSVREMTDQCLVFKGEVICEAVGGDFGATSNQLSCKNAFTATSSNDYTGFRCCKDL